MNDKKYNTKSEEDISIEPELEETRKTQKKDKLKKSHDDLKACKKEREEYLVGWQRARADYVNLQKELEQVRSNTSILVKEEMVRGLLPVLDSFDMAFINKGVWEKVDKEWRMGIEYIHQQLVSSLENSGIDKIDSEGVSFDPQIHHSLKMVKTNDKTKDHTISEVIQAGYKMKVKDGTERVIRPARVNVYELK